MTFSTSIATTAQSAAEVLQILDRQARKDCTKIARFTYRTYLALTSSQAIALYRAIWRTAVAFYQFVQASIDSYVEDCLKPAEQLEMQHPADVAVDVAFAAVDAVIAVGGAIARMPVAVRVWEAIGVVYEELRGDALYGLRWYRQRLQVFKFNLVKV